MVNLLDKENDLITRASLNQEGKIHIGMVYAMDETLETPHKMIEDALMFAPVMEELTGHPIEWKKITSTPFLYLVHRKGLVDATTLESRYRQYEAYYQEQAGRKDNAYLRQFEGPYFEQIAFPEEINPAAFEACFKTFERAVDPHSIRSILKQCIGGHPSIRLITESEVVDIERYVGGFKTMYRQDGGYEKVSSDIVINASWESKKRIDSFLGLKNEDSWHVRLKLGFTFQLDNIQPLHSFTIVQGPFGDFVHFPGQGYGYLSWYPLCKLDATNETEIPAQWSDILEGRYESLDLSKIWQETLTNFQAFLPGLNPKGVVHVKAGTVVAYGHSDIHEVNSGLHRRNEVPVSEHDGYFSIHTSKFTSAPHNARKLGNLV